MSRCATVNARSLTDKERLTKGVGRCFLVRSAGEGQCGAEGGGGGHRWPPQD